MHLIFSKRSFASVVSLLILSQTESFASKSPSISFPIVTPKSHNHYYDAAPSSFLAVPRGGFTTSNGVRSPASSSLQMTTASAVSGGGGKEESKSVGGGTATVPSEIFNLVKNIVGAGVLSLPAGVAAFGNAPSALIPGILLISVLGVISGYNFSLIGRICSYTGSNSYKEAWEKSVGESSGWIPATACTFMTFAAVLAYSMILADTFKALAATIGYGVTRTQSLFGITGFVLLPLCLLKNLASLAPFSLLGIIGMTYTTIAMAIRYFGEAYKLPAGRFVADLATEFQPSFGTVGAAGALSPNSFILISMLSTAFMAHFNAPKFFNELKDNTIERYNTVVSSSFGISIAIFAAITSFGFLTFGKSASGLILNNYATNDILASFTRIAVAVSIVFSYPLNFSGLRDGVMDMANTPQEKRTNSLFDKTTFALLSIITGLALKVKDISFVLSFGGATIGNFLIYVFPALMFRATVKKMDNATDSMKKEAKGVMGTAILGVLMSIIGSVMAIKSVTA